MKWDKMIFCSFHVNSRVHICFWRKTRTDPIFYYFQDRSRTVFHPFTTWYILSRSNWFGYRVARRLRVNAYCILKIGRNRVSDCFANYMCSYDARAPWFNVDGNKFNNTIFSRETNEIVLIINRERCVWQRARQAAGGSSRKRVDPNVDGFISYCYVWIAYIFFHERFHEPYRKTVRSIVVFCAGFFFPSSCFAYFPSSFVNVITFVRAQ